VLLVSALLVAIITFGGWSTLQGAQVVSIFYILVYLTMAFFVMRWSRGMLPLAASLAVGLGVFAAIAAPAWFDRAHPDYADPSIDPNLLGTLCVLTVIVQGVLVVFADDRLHAEVEHRGRGVRLRSRRRSTQRPTAAGRRDGLAVVP